MLASRYVPRKLTFSALPRAAASQNPGAFHSRRLKSTQPAYEEHVPLNWFEHAFMFVGASYMSLFHPARGDMVAAVADLTSGPVLPTLRDKMLASPEGRRILKERPRINTQTVDMQKLASMRDGTFGRAYISWLERCGVTPDTREPVHYVDDPELAYVLQRYRECHDFYHCIVNLPVNVESELAVKFFEFANLGLPMAGFASAFGHIRLSSTKRARVFKEYVPWAIKCGSSAQSLITVYWEERWEQDVEELKKELGIWDAPPARWGKASSEAQLAAEKKLGETTILK